MDTDYILRLLSNGKNVSECERLLKIAALDASSGLSVQTAAVYYLNNEKLLKEIVEESRDTMVIRDAIAKIQDEKFLRGVFYSTEENSKLVILKKLGDSNQDFFKAVSVAKLSNIVKTSAIERLNDENFIYENFVSTDKCEVEVARVAVKKLTQSELLYKTIVEHKSAIVKLDALLRLKPNDKFIATIAEDTNYPTYLRKIAIEKYTDFTPDVLIKLYNDSVENISLAALRKFQWETHREPLIFIATSHKEKSFRKEAISKIYDETVLRDIALNGKDSILRRYAVRNIDDQALLEKLMKDKDYFVRYEAVQKITNIEALMFIVETEYATDINEIALRKLKGYDHFLGRVVRKFGSSNTHIAAKALTMISDVDVLYSLKEDQNVSWVLRAYIVTK